MYVNEFLRVSFKGTTKVFCAEGFLQIYDVCFTSVTEMDNLGAFVTVIKTTNIKRDYPECKVEEDQSLMSKRYTRTVNKPL